MRATDAGQNNDSEEVEVQMTPMIDCVFLLLIFFLCASTLRKPHKELPVKVAHTAVSIKSDQPEPLVLRLEPDGEVFLGVDKMTAKLLDELFTQVVTETPTRLVRVDAAREAPMQYLVRLLDHLQFAGLKRIDVKARTMTVMTVGSLRNSGGPRPADTPQASPEPGSAKPAGGN
jgi:biopolymer transport protein ExbD